MNVEEIREALRANGLGHLADEVDRLTLPAIRIATERTKESSLSVGASKIGGHPDLPVDFTWPEHDGKPFGFLAQLNLEELALYDVEHVLPKTGMLYFFYDFAAAAWGLESSDRGSWQVLYREGDAQTSRRASWPASLKSLHWLPAHRLQFLTDVTLTEEADLIANLSLSQEERRQLVDLAESFAIHDGHHAYDDDDDDPDIEFEVLASRHQLLGYPLLVHNGGMPWECETVASGQPNPHFSELRHKPYSKWDEKAKMDLARAYSRWRLLFQLGNVSGMSWPEGDEDDDDPAWRLSELCDLWARGGLMYFWIERDRLAQRDFSNVWMLGASQL